MRGTSDCASARACACGALARRIEHHRPAAGKLGRHQRAAEQVARFRLDRLEARRTSARASAEIASASVSKAMTRARSASRKANVPTPQNRSATNRASPTASVTSRARISSASAVACRKLPGGSATRARPIRIDGSCELRHQVAVAGDARELFLGADPRQRRRHFRIQRPGAAQVHVEAAVGRGEREIDGLAGRLQRLDQPPGDGDGAFKHWHEHRTLVDRHDDVRPRPEKPTVTICRPSASRMQHHAPAALAVGIDQIADRRFDPGLVKRGEHETPLPDTVGVGAPMLQRAAAAGAEMRADRLDALRARHDHAKQSRAVALPLHLDRLAGQRIGNVDRAFGRFGDGVAAVAHARDAEGLGHAFTPALPRCAAWCASATAAWFDRRWGRCWWICRDGRECGGSGTRIPTGDPCKVFRVLSRQQEVKRAGVGLERAFRVGATDRSGAIL